MLELQSLSVSKRLESVTVKTDGPQVIHLLGSNGAGKSSLLLSIAGLLSADRGHLYWHGKSIAEFSLAKLACFRTLVQQQQQSVFPVSVAEALSFFSCFTEIPQAIEEALELNGFMQRPLTALSGGELRRVQIARGLLQVWPAIEKGLGLVLLDEPMQGLDIRHQHLLCDLLSGLANRGNLVIFSHHDLNLCQQYAQNVWLMHQGQLIAEGHKEKVLNEDNLLRAFDCRIKGHLLADGTRFFQAYL